MVALALALVLCVPPALAQAPEDTQQRSKFTKYVIPIAFVVSLVAVGAVLVTALLVRNDDRVRLRAATAKVDQALARGFGAAAAGTAPYNIRSASVETRQATGRGMQLVGPGPLRTPPR
jgi:hypothetical protein